MRSNALIVGSLFITAALLVGCSSTGASPSAAPASQAPASVAPPASAPAESAAGSAPASGAVTVEAKPVGTVGTVLVDGASGRTLYIFTKDTKDSGKSVCTADGGCISTWPALTVAAGATPTAGGGVTGTLATITRDDGALQVTYNGLPLYFYAPDTAAGMVTGVYEFWEVVKP
jgi:predicted lipoprotein with Yx(FWY)xxD motif